MPKYNYLNKHIDLDSESNGSAYLNELGKNGWRLFQVIYRDSFRHPLCIFEKEEDIKEKD